MHCSGCHTPIKSDAKTRKVDGQTYHPNCVPSHDPRADAEYYQGIREGYQWSRERRELGDEVADARELAREMQREGYRVDMPPAIPGPDARDSEPTPKRKRNPRTAKPAKDMTRDECAAEYRAIRKRMTGSLYLTNEAFDKAVKAHLTRKGVDSPTPAQFVVAARNVRFECPRCMGSGQFTTWIENGKPRGPGGACFRCNGKGSQSDADVRRNYGHDITAPHIVC